MLQKHAAKIATKLHDATCWNLSRCKCFANILCAAITTRSVCLADPATAVHGSATLESKARRVQYFFADFRPCYAKIAIMIVAVLGKLLDQKWLLAIDRTNWQRRDNDVNLLVLAVCLGDLAIPLFWVDLQHKGNSDCQQRTELVQRFLDTFGADRIRAITGDREFVGKDWFKWLKDREIPFVLRIRNNFQVSTTCGRATDVWNCFRNLKMNERKVLGVRKVVGLQLCVSGIRLGGNEYVILVSDGVSGAAIFGLYRERWRIETLFQKLKGHGFDLERSRLRGAGKSELLLSILALGTAWRYALGRRHVVAVKSLRLKCDGLFCRSLFRVGLDLLRQVLHGCASCFRRLCRQAIRLICAIPSVRILDSP